MKHSLNLIIGIGLLQCLGSCESKPSPVDVVRSWSTHMSEGECDKAQKLEVEALPTLLEIPELPCEAYPSEIESIVCETTEETATCDCVETRGVASAATYTYDLKKVDGEWKIAAGY